MPLTVALRGAALAAALLISMSCARAQPVEAPVDPHSPAEETKIIRKHHLKRLDERLHVDAETLHHLCRYDSEIGEAPPLKKVALTFDDGPDPERTKYILAVLEKYKVPATFFMIGEKVQAHPELLNLVQASPYALVGNHSWSHPNFHDISIEEQATQVGKSDALFAKSTAPKLFRYPYGNSTCETNAVLKTSAYKIVGWHVDSCDWAFDHNGTVDAKDALICGVLPQNRDNFLDHVMASVRAHNGGIILMHEIHPNTLRQLDKLVELLVADGYIFGKLNDPEFERLLR